MIVSRAQFDLQVDRLSDTFGDRYFPEQRTLMMWDAAKGKDYDAIIGVVDNFIRCAKQAPLPAEFSVAVSEATKGSQKKYALGDLQPKEIASCRDCADSGFIRLLRNKEYDEWAKWQCGSAPCHCYRGKALGIAAKKAKSSCDLGPQFGEHWRKSYSVLDPWSGYEDENHGPGAA